MASKSLSSSSSEEEDEDEDEVEELLDLHLEGVSGSCKDKGKGHHFYGLVLRVQCQTP